MRNLVQVMELNQVITSNIKELEAKWKRFTDNISASVERLQQELSDWFSSVQSQLQLYLSKADQLRTPANVCCGVRRCTIQ